MFQTQDILNVKILDDNWTNSEVWNQCGLKGYNNKGCNNVVKCTKCKEEKAILSIMSKYKISFNYVQKLYKI